MAINKKLIHFQNKATFDSELAAGNILNTSIVFIKDAKLIYTHGQLYPCPYTQEELTALFNNKANLSELDNYLKKTDAEKTYIKSIPTANGTTAGIVKQGGDVTISNGIITVNDDSHNHVIANVDGLQTALDNKQDLISDLSTIRSNASKGATALQSVPLATSSSLGGVRSGGDITISSEGIMSVVDDSHNHVISNVDGLQNALDAKQGVISDLQTIRSGAALGATALQSVPAATTSTAGIVKVGSNISVSSGTISLSKDNVTAALGYTPPTAYTNMTASEATTGTATTGRVISAKVLHDKINEMLPTTLSEAKSYTDTKVSELVGQAPDALNTIYELAEAMATNQSAVDTLESAIGNKVDKVSGKGLSTNDYTTTEKNKLAGIASGAEVNVQSDWSVTDTTSDAYILNKPSLAAVATSGKYSDLSGRPTVDSAISTSSTNAVQNKAITAAVNAKYTKPSTGIPSSDLSSDVQGALAKANSALQSFTETDPVFAASVAASIKSSDITNWNSKTSNTGTITGIKMNGNVKGTSGVVDLGTVITAHQDISGKVDKVSGKGLSTNDYTTDEKTKLSGIATGAEVNQNAFSNIKVGDATVQADSKTDTLTLVAGSNVTITPDTTNDSITIAAKDTTYSAATSSAAGLMSATDKAKLDTITNSADAVSFTQSLTSGTKVGTININGSDTVLYAPTNTNTTYTFEGGTNKFTVTPSGGTAYDVTVTPSISNNVTHTGTATSGQVAVFDSNGKIKSTGYTIASSVPSGAKFTDTTYAAGAGLSMDGTTINVGAGTGIVVADDTVGLANSGVTSGSYGPSANATATHSGSFSVPYITVDSYGRVTGASTKTITLPSSGNTNWTTGIVAGASGATSNSSQTNPYIAVKDNSTYRSQIRLVGGGATSVQSDASGNITISSTNTTYNDMVGASSSAAGASGLVPQPAAGKQGQFLRGDGTWATPTNTTYTAMTQDEANTGTATTARSITAAVLSTTIANKIAGKLDSSTASSTYATKTEVTNGLSGKVDKISGKGLSTNDYTTDEKNKLAGIASGAEVNQNAFAKISDGTTTIVADAKQDTLNVEAGSGIALTLDATNDKLTISHSDTSTLSGAYGPSANVTGSNGQTIVVPQITVDGYGHVTGVTNRTYTSKDTTYSAISADELTTGTASTSRVVTAAVLGPWVKSQIDSKIAAADAMIYKGTIGTDGTITALPDTTAKTGWTYKVITAGTYAGVTCEVGDMIICLTDGSSSTNATWTVVQNNIDGAVTGPSSSVNNRVAVFNGTTGKVIKDSGYTIGKSVPSDAVFTDTKQFTIAANANDDDVVVLSGSNGTNAVTYTASHAKQGPSSAFTSTASTKTTISGSGASGTINIPKVNVNTYGHVTSVTNETVAITMPTLPTLSGLGGVGSVSASGTAPLTLSASKSGTAVTITGSVATMGAASSSADGSAGLVPKPTAGNQGKYLRADGTWATPTNTTYTQASLGQGYGTCTTAEATTAKVVTLSNYALSTGGIVSVKFTYAVPASATMNVNSKGAKAIYYKGAAITAGIIKAGDVATFIYDGTQYHLLSTDRTKVEISRSLTSGVKIGTITIDGIGVDLYCRDNDTHWTTGINAGASGATSNSVVTNPYITVKDNSTYRSQIQLKGGGSTSITSDADGIITISSTNSWRGITDSVSTTDSTISGSATAVKTAYDKAVSAYNLANSKTSNTGTVTSIVAGTGLNGGTISTTGTISVKYGTAAGTACVGNDSRLSDARNPKTTTLNSEDLDSITTPGLYNGGGSNTVTNKPSGIDAFGLFVFKTASGYTTQELIEGNTNAGCRWTRQYTGSSWTSWLPMPTFSATPTSGQVVVTDGTTGKIKSSGYTIAKSVPSNAVFTDTNTKVNVTLGTTTKAYLLGTSTTPTSSAQGVTSIADTGVYLGTTAGELVATKFTGALSGNASTASSAAKLTNARTLTIGSTGKTFNGEANVSWTLDEIGAAAKSHGYHVPTPETANNAKFLRNDNTWQTVTPANIGAAASSHGTHVTYATAAPLAAGTAAVGTSSKVAREDHVHPVQTTVSGNAGSATKLANARKIDGVNFTGEADVTHFAECSTTASTAAKTITISNFALVTGARVAIKFTVTNTASSPTLNVSGTGAKSIMYRGSAISAGYLAANRVYEFVYDGTDWELIGDINTDNNTYPSAYCSTGASTAAKAASCSGYVLTANTYIHLIITTANTAASALTLNINGKGAKTIYINGTASSSSNYTLPAGSYLAYYDGSYYHLRTDGMLPGKILAAKNADTVNGLTVQTAVPANAVFTDTKQFTITANGSDDDVVILSKSNGTNAVTYGVSHAKTFGNTTAPYTAKYTSGNTTTSISGSGGSGTIKIPQITVDEYGHVRAGADESVTITMPTLPTTLKNPNKLTVGSKTYDGSAAVEVTATDLGLSQAMRYIGKTSTSISDGSTTSSITIGSSTVTVKQGDVVIDNSDKKEYIWNGSKWEEFGNEGNYKVTQAAVSDPTASSNSITFIDTISQDAQGVISPTKKTVRSATTSATGIVQLSSSTSSTSETLAATPKAVKAAYDLAASKAASSHTHTKSQITDFPSITNMTTKGYIDYNTNLMTTNTLAYWNGAYASTNASNLTYCAQGTIIGSNNIGSQTVNKANQLTTARTISLTGDVTGSASFDGSSNASITATVADNSHNHYDSNITWGSNHLSGYISPIDAAASYVHSANRFQFAKAAGITVEYSRDGGSTWTDYGLTDAQKIELVSGIGCSCSIGKRTSGVTTSDKLRITFNATNMGVYTAATSLLVNLSTNGAGGSNVVVERSMKGSETTFSTWKSSQGVSGWSGWNRIPMNGVSFGGGSTQTSNTAAIRLTFGITSLNTSHSSSLTISDFVLLGTTYWSYPHNMAKTGHIYSWDSAGNATFGAKVTASSFSGSLNASNLTGTINSARLPSHTHSVTAKGSNTSTTATGTVASSFTGTAHKHTFTGSAVTSGGPSGTTSVYSITGVGTLPSCTLPTVSVSYSAGTLTITHNAGSFSAGSLPTRSSVTLPKSDHTHSVTATGTLNDVTATGSVSSTFTGTSHTHTFTGSAVTSGSPSY